MLAKEKEIQFDFNSSWLDVVQDTLDSVYDKDLKKKKKNPTTESQELNLLTF